MYVCIHVIVYVYIHMIDDGQRPVHLLLGTVFYTVEFMCLPKLYIGTSECEQSFIEPYVCTSLGGHHGCRRCCGGPLGGSE